ncbi:MAG: hypothetical protein KOO60_07150 [Gemmatimonadales bacterium]|nr:hypothetical protein [Gemmatimonadales bacterium]
MKKFFVNLCLVALLAICGSALAGIDDFENTGPNFTYVNSRVNDGVTVTISNASGLPYLSVTYFDEGSHCFLGADDVVNAPVDPLRVSGDIFISTADNINTDMPIVFEFSTPLGSFGLTTLDVLEDVQTSADAEVRLQGFNGDTLVAEHVISGVQGGSGIDLDWEITSQAGITRAVLLRTAGTISAGYGIDDLVLVTMPVSDENSTLSGIKALYR